MNLSFHIYAVLNKKFIQYFSFSFLINHIHHCLISRPDFSFTFCFLRTNYTIAHQVFFSPNLALVVLIYISYPTFHMFLDMLSFVFTGIKYAKNILTFSDRFMLDFS
jgi:hypothetical protein